MMKDTLTVHVIQTDLIWHDPDANRAQFDTYFETVPKDVDLILLPEMCTSGFTMHPEVVAEKMKGITISWLKKWAKRLDAAVGCSVVVKKGHKFYNRFVFVHPDGDVDKYDKRHTFNLAGEGEVYEAGNKMTIVEYRGWKLMLQICYDLRFPVFSRNTKDYDVVVYVANWPKARISAWDTLLQARAIENMAYSIGVNRTGIDGNDLEYVGHSAVYDVLGNVCAFAKADTKTITATLSKSHIETTRKALPFLADRDQFLLKK